MCDCPAAAEVTKELRSIYPGDEIFRANFTTKVFDTSNNRNKQVVRYILAKIDAQTAGTPFSSPSSEITVEHILPENPADNWPQFSEADAASEVYRIGNMILLEDKLNRNASNLSFSRKKPFYGQSIITTAIKMATEAGDWDVEKIQIRQQGLARTATGIWRIAQLH
ncbi:MAG: HNH endonuclease [Roseicyclus sp.]|nr:HNH endonuclease [Roseicyclus sp.]